MSLFSLLHPRSLYLPYGLFAIRGGLYDPNFYGGVWQPQTESDYRMIGDRGSEFPVSLQWIHFGEDRYRSLLGPTPIGVGFGGGNGARLRRAFFNGTELGQLDLLDRPAPSCHCFSLRIDEDQFLVILKMLL